jgi:uncharacterized protein YjbI with pentapeptide repeats
MEIKPSFLIIKEHKRNLFHTEIEAGLIIGDKSIIRLNEANLVETDLNGANLKGTNLFNVIFNRKQLDQSNDLTDINLSTDSSAKP